MRRPLVLVVEAFEETVENDVTEEYAETSERLEFVRDKETSDNPSSLGLRVPAGVRPVGGTSWTCRLSGWLDLDGGGLTTMNDYKIAVSLALKA